MSSPRVVVTGLGTVNAALAGDSRALDAFLAAPRSARPGRPPGVAALAPGALGALVDAAAARRLSRACQLTGAAARLALAEAGAPAGDDLGLVVGSEFGDLRSTLEFADGYLQRGPTGISALLFPNTVMNTMAATTAIAVAARGVSLTLNTAGVAGELAVARAAAMVAAGRLPAVIAGGVDDLDPAVGQGLASLDAGDDLRGEGATLLVLESATAAAARGAPALGEILGAAWRALPARPHGVGRQVASRAIAAALAQADLRPRDLGWVYGSASGDAARDAWERAILTAALGAPLPPTASLAGLVGHHSGLGALRVGAAAWTARHGRLVGAGVADDGGDTAAPGVGSTPVDRGPGLVHAVARGGVHVAIVVGPAPR